MASPSLVQLTCVGGNIVEVQVIVKEGGKCERGVLRLKDGWEGKLGLPKVHIYQKDYVCIMLYHFDNLSEYKGQHTTHMFSLWYQVFCMYKFLPHLQVPVYDIK